MIPELGHFALILALAVTLVLATLPAIGAHKNIQGWMQMAKPAAFAQLLFMSISFACLTWVFITNDFSVTYAANNSNSDMPLIYRISAVWGAHEGSLLLWAFSLSIWTAAVAAFSKGVPENMRARVLSVMGMVGIGFLLFMLFTSNPFERLYPIPLQGRSLNPLLQDPGLALHPPMLYMGYVGFAVAFAFSIAAMLSGRLDAAWARWARPWTNIAWVFLTGGITLGSWWAYYELGWGGWWFWDPVENASFMPWLVGTALVHSLAVTEKRGMFKAWTVLLAVLAFSLSLLGTFLVRSGVLTSVHAFATDPTRGVFILVFLAVVVGGSLILYAWRAPQFSSDVQFEPLSRETALLINNVLLVVVTASILLGTLYPLAVDALGIGKISVGPPYFNAIFVPLTIPLALLVGVGAVTRWKQDKSTRLASMFAVSAGISVVSAIILPLLLPYEFQLGAAVAIGLAVWVILTSLQGLYARVAKREQKLSALASIPRSFYGMTLAHLGIAIFIVGVSLVSIYSIEKDIRMAPGESYELGGYTFRFDGVTTVQGPNYSASRGSIVILQNGVELTSMDTEKRAYKSSSMPMTEAGIDAGLTRDLFVALGEPLGKDGAWSLRLYHKPFIRWIWFGALMMALGGLLAATDRRYRMSKQVDKLAIGGVS